MTDETRVLAPDPQDRWRLVRVATEFLTQFGTRTDDGRKLVATWGEPDDLGVYEPTFTATDDGMTLVPTATLERARRIEEKARAVALDCIRNAIAIRAGEVRDIPLMFWGARRPCDEYTDGRELCAPCALRAALEDDR